MKASEYAKTLFLVAIVVLLTSRKQAGFLLVFLAPLFLVSLTKGAVAMIRKSEERRRRGIRIAIWTTALFAILAIHWYWFEASRRDADLAVAAVLAHKARSGALPNTLAEAGLDQEKLLREWKLVYSVRNGEPLLLYPTTFTVFETYSYDFRSKQWHYNPD